MVKNMVANKNTNKQNLTREEVMRFLRQENIHEILSPDDCLEIFLNILGGSSDLTKEILDRLLSNYGIDIRNIVTIEGLTKLALLSKKI